MKTTEVNNHHKERLVQYISMREIDAPAGQRSLRNLTELVASIQRLRLMQPILLTPRGTRYRIIDGGCRYQACARLGWSEIPAIILDVDDLHAELATIDANSMREELTPFERVALRWRRRELPRTIYKRRNGPGRGHRKDEPQARTAPAADRPSRTDHTPHTILQLIGRLLGIQDKRHSPAALL